jgi:hypothetical protein
MNKQITTEKIEQIKKDAKNKMIEDIVFAMRNTDRPWTRREAQAWVEKHQKNNEEYAR